MAELLMECEEEELEPWQQRIKEVEDDDDDDDDEPIFVREISSAKVTNTNNTPGTQQSTFPRVENGTPNRGVAASFTSPVNHYKNPPSNTGTQPVTSVYQSVTRPASSSAIVQALPRPVCPPEPIKRTLPGCLPAQPRANPAILQPVCRPVTIVSNSQPVCRNITFPAMTQPALRPVATITAQPVILNQGYIVNSPQGSSNSQNVMYALRPGTTLTQFQGMQAVTATGNATQLVQPLQPMTQIRPVSTPSRTAPTLVQRPAPKLPLVTQNSLVQVQQQPLFAGNSQKNQQGIHGQNLPGAGRIENASTEKRPAPIEITSISPKKTKTNENGPNIRPVATLSNKPTAQAQNSPVNVNVGTTSGPSPQKNGAPFPRACPKCNIHFNLLEPMKRHMTYCCSDKMHNFFHGITDTEVTSSQGMAEESEKGKLIMLVSDFYYGRHPGDVQLAQQEQKTHTTFRCFSCQKLLKNNIRFMNHMKHHLELEKQSTESWENHTTCHHCYRQFPTPFQLQCHIESSHTLYESTTICKICELSFESEQILLQHMKDNHKPGEMPYVCQVCNFRSSSFVEVDTHFRNSHENTKSLLCPFCLKVIKCGTPFMQHYMKHQNKGVYRCAKCRLQFLTCKEKMDHKTQHHRTFRKPKQLEGLPPGTKVTIRASVGNVNTASTTTTSICTSPPSTPVQTPKSKNTNTKTNQASATKSNVQQVKSKPPPQKKLGNANTTTTTTTTTTKRIKIINSALRNLGCVSGLHKCIECQLEVKDFESHYHTYVHCSKCKFSTSCNKAYMNHMMSFHGRNSHKRSKGFKKTHKDKRRITLVCLNCDFLTDVSGIDDMAKHLGKSHSHSCQVIMETVSIISSTLQGDISKSIYDPSVGLRQTYCKKESGTHVLEKTNNSTGEKNEVVMKQEESSIVESHAFQAVQRNTSLCNIEIASEKPKDDSAKNNTENCFTNADVGKAELCEKNNCSAKEEQVASKEDESSQAPDNTAFSEDTEDLKQFLEPLDKIEDNKDCNSDEDVSFVQFLRRRDDTEYVGSDTSYQSSVHLEPLTPSEVLEHEATEILQKGVVATSPQKCSSSDQAIDVKDAGTKTHVVAVKTEEDHGES
ncbi:zinc finger protein 280D isoform X1 [Pelobates fuscus]|uniref:zinc finger protein 280D isoform X1 n=1 Tax=Pelobates fuscus TaxID=191477 RepID=UPI002FE4EE52